MSESSVRIGLVLPDVMGTYGDGGNAVVLRQRLRLRGIDADIRWNNEGSFHKDELKDLRFDYILANPPFNISD